MEKLYDHIFFIINFYTPQCTHVFQRDLTLISVGYFLTNQGFHRFPESRSEMPLKTSATVHILVEICIKCSSNNSTTWSYMDLRKHFSNQLLCYHHQYRATLWETQFRYQRLLPIYPVSRYPRAIRLFSREYGVGMSSLTLYSSLSYIEKQILFLFQNTLVYILVICSN